MMQINKYRLIFWDFDGVIKDSVDIKTHAFLKIFESYGAQVAKKVKSHHEAHGGMSRFDKLPIYLRWANEDPTADKVNEFCEQFSQLAVQGVIDSLWVPGAEDYLRNNPHRQTFVLISATPQEEIEHILGVLNLQNCFIAVFGAPMSKTDAIRMTLNDLNIAQQDCLVIGDARADMEAAQSNHVQFLLRLHATNADVFAEYKGPSIRDLTEL